MGDAMLSVSCSDEEAVEYAFQHYFFPEELAEARLMLQGGRAYEEAIAYLVDRGHSTLRNSGEPQPPRMFITIPGGNVFIRHPARLYPHRPIWEGHVSALACVVFPRPATEIQPETPVALTNGNRYQQFSLFDEEMSGTNDGKAEKPKRTSARAKKLKYLEQSVRMGTQKTWWAWPGWVVKDEHLGYVIKKLKEDFYGVSLVHCKSNHVMATVYLSVLDETTHARVRGWIADALQITDWSRGITAILKEKTGEHKKRAWSRQLEELWKKHSAQRYQFSLFDTGEPQ
ncbi:hypothetical protein KDA_74790 [Dictyobacter alpinus]|uniref:Uncharacterized protein n=2 Tax=Dictyobacter alpinus TaxID=2014873 RepID=A0A402BKW1_9CHLR|nr:hypothetical protein KDA_74790 [Dictyobacter alpinus]